MTKLKHALLISRRERERGELGERNGRKIMWKMENRMRIIWNENVEMMGKRNGEREKRCWRALQK